jgi:hypothetical protein
MPSSTASRATRSSLLDPSPEGREIPPATPALGQDRAPGDIEMLGLEATTARPPRTPFNGPISRHRRFAFGRLSLDAVRALKGRSGAPSETSSSRAARVAARARSVAGRAARRHRARLGPRARNPLFLAGAQLQAAYPVSVVVDGAGLNITVMSYRDHLDFGIVTDRDLVDDVCSISTSCAARSRSSSGRWGSRPGRRRGGRRAPSTRSAT